MIYKIGDVYCISSGGCYLPGVYDSERAAKYAFRFPNKALHDLQCEVNAREPDKEKRMITFGMLQVLAKQLKEDNNAR